eukprot:376733-Pleurochrysis_carterae.AAC.1
MHAPSQEFVTDQLAAGRMTATITSRVWFSKTFRTHPDLEHTTVASGKENFGRCTVCSSLQEAIRQAQKSGLAQLAMDKKEERRVDTEGSFLCLK